MFVACGIWCLADVSSVSPSSEQTDCPTGDKHTISTLLIKPIFYILPGAFSVSYNGPKKLAWDFTVIEYAFDSFRVTQQQLTALQHTNINASTARHKFLQFDCD